LTVDEYFAMILMVLMGLTFIALLLIFYYMVYGEKEESTPSPKTSFYGSISEPIRLCSLGYQTLTRVLHA